MLFFLITYQLSAQIGVSQYDPQTYLMQFDPGTTNTDINLLLDSMNCEEIWVSPITNTRLWEVRSTFPYYNAHLGQDIIDINEQRDISRERAHVDETDLNFYFNVSPNNASPGPLNNYCYEMQDGDGDDSPTVKVSILDTGFDGSIFGVTPSTSKDYVHNSSSVKDLHGHGTFIYSIIEDAFMQNTGLPATHLEWDIRRTHDDQGQSTLSNIILALEEAVLDGADIVNMSFSYVDALGIESQGIMNHVIDVIETNNVLIVAAAGNDSEDLDDNRYFNCFPVQLPSYNILSVGSFDCDAGTLSSFSNYGLYSVDIAAPGDKIRGYSGKNLVYSQKSGTSQATALVTGVAAALAIRQTIFDYIPVKCAILSGAVHKTSLNGKILTGGFINAQNAFMELGAGCTTIIDNPYSLPYRSRKQVESGDNAIMVSPNPVSDMLYITNGPFNSNYDVTIISSNGQVVKQIPNNNNEEIALNISNYPIGIYTVKITEDGKSQFRKVLIQR